MPTIDQLPVAAQAVATADELPISQLIGAGRVTGKTTIGALLAVLAASAMLPVGILVGQGPPTGATGTDGWSYVNAATGDLWQRAAGVWSKIGSLAGPQGTQGTPGPTYSIAGLPTASTIAGTDLVGISQSAGDRNITLANLLEGETIDQGSPAGPATDIDTLWVGQGGSTMLVQTLAGLWTWIAGRLPGWKRPVVEIKTTTQLDASIHNNAILVCSQAVTINPAFATQGSGFRCTVINLSGGPVMLGAGITASNGAGSIPVGQAAELYAVAYSGGSAVYAEVSGGGTALTAPGQVTGPTVGSVTSNTVALTWTAPTTGGAPATYTVNFRVTGTTPWSNVSASGTSFTVPGLTASTAYDFEVIAANAAGAGAASAIVNATTGAASSYAPNVPTGVTIGTITNASAALSWTAPATDATHGAATSYTVQWRVTGTSAWTQQTGISTTSATVTGLIASTQYDLQVQAVNAAGSSAFTTTVNAITAASGGNYLMGSGFQPYAAGTSYAHASTVPSANVTDMTTSGDGSHTAPANVFFGWSASATVAPTGTTDMTAAQGQFANGGHNYWYLYNLPTPATAGTYFMWAVGVNTSGTIVESAVQANQVAAGGTPVAFTIT